MRFIYFRRIAEGSHERLASMNDAVRSRPVFIVGLSRTGTTITRAVLNASPLVGIGGESLFLPGRSLLGLRVREAHRDRFRRIGNLNTDKGISRVADYIYSQTTSKYWRRLAATLDRRLFEARIRASDRTDRALLDIAMTHFASGRPIRGDKSPQHIHSVPLLLEWYPEAKVIHTFRDPRAVYLSTQRKASARVGADAGQRVASRRFPRWLAHTPRPVSFSIGVQRSQLHRLYEARYPEQYTLLRYEDLVSDPAVVTRRLCSFIGVPFVEEMLDQVVMNSSFGRRGDSKGFDVRSKRDGAASCRR